MCGSSGIENKRKKIKTPTIGKLVTFMEINNHNEFFERKEKLVLKEFDSGFSNYQKLEGKVASLRQWTITLNVAFVLYTLEKCNKLSPVLIVVFLFMLIILIHELRERASMKFDKENILLLEQIFNTVEQESYKNKIVKYKFRDEVISNLDAKTKLKHYWNSIYKGEVIVWYGMWVIVWSVLILIKRWTTIICPFVTLNQIIYGTIVLIILTIGILVTLKYFKFSWLLKWFWNEMKFSFRKLVLYSKTSRRIKISTRFKRVKKGKIEN